MVVLMVGLVGCGASKYRTMYGISDWYYTNHITLEAQYAQSTPDQQAWQKKNINPYMNIMRQAVIAMAAIDKGDAVKASLCASEILKIATGIQYNPTRLVTAIQAKDYDTLFAESLVLKDFIILKLKERK